MSEKEYVKKVHTKRVGVYLGTFAWDPYGVMVRIPVGVRDVAFYNI